MHDFGYFSYARARRRVALSREARKGTAHPAGEQPRDGVRVA
jgi:hypothetical protein